MYIVYHSVIKYCTVQYCIVWCQVWHGMAQWGMVCYGPEAPGGPLAHGKMASNSIGRLPTSRNTDAHGVEELGHRKPRSVVVHIMQMFNKTAPEVLSSFTNVKKRTLAARMQQLCVRFLDWQVKCSWMEKKHLGPYISVTVLQVLHQRCWHEQEPGYLVEEWSGVDQHVSWAVKVVCHKRWLWESSVRRMLKSCKINCLIQCLHCEMVIHPKCLFLERLLWHIPTMLYK